MGWFEVWTQWQVWKWNRNSNIILMWHFYFLFLWISFSFYYYVYFFLCSFASFVPVFISISSSIFPSRVLLPCHAASTNDKQPKPDGFTDRMRKLTMHIGEVGKEMYIGMYILFIRFCDEQREYETNDKLFNLFWMNFFFFVLLFLLCRCVSLLII